MQIGIGISKEKELLSALQDALWQAKKEIGNKKLNIGFLFSSPEFASSNLLKTLCIYLPQTPIVGATTLGVLSRSQIHRHSLAICLISSDNLKISTAVVKDISKKDAFLAGQDLGAKLLEDFKGQKRDFVMLFCDGLLKEGSRLIHGLQEKLGTSFPIAGASASDNLKFKQTYIYYNDELLNDAAVGVLFGGKIVFNLSSRHGWRPLGKARTVTQSEGNILKEIDNQPAINLYQDYFAKDITLLKRDLKYISTLYPIGIYLEGEEEYLLRNIHSIEEDGSLVCQGDVPPKSTVRLMIGTKDSCLSASLQATEELVKGFNIPTVIKKNMDIVLIFDSASRYALLRRAAEEELKIVQNTVSKDVPILGLYTYGEQAPLKALSYQGRSHFHNQSIVLTAVGD
ncbi:MAG: FIST C-terminal domain-containing protein [Candidatus Omnitrophica bacterium]|nr:FIST C-terminal domain-containing protein [Candidatus Omnitrophota bacterium]